MSSPKETMTESEETSWSCWLRTVFAGSGAMVVFVFAGVLQAHSAVLLPQLRNESSPIHVTPDEETWIASLGVSTTPIAAILAGPAVDAFGRKKGLLFFYLTMSLGFGVITFATKVYHIYIGRAICAFAAGVEVASVVYVAEICTSKQRSVFFSLVQSVFAAGIVVTYIVGGYLPWNIASGIFSLVSLFYFIIQCFAPESPAWLYKMGKQKAAKRSLQRLGRSPADVAKELETLRLSSKKEAEEFEFRQFLEPTVWKPFVILSLFHILQCASGYYDILYYTVDFVENLGTTYNPLTVSILVSTTRFVTASSLGVYFTASVNRKSATAVSGFCMMVALFGAGTYEYMYRNTAPNARTLQWVPITLIVVNIVGSTFGVTTLPWTMSGEVFPLPVRGTMTGAVFVVGTGVLFVFIKMYRLSLDVLQIWGLLFSFAAPCFVIIIFGIFMLPETQNKTLYEIQQGFLPKKKRQAVVSTTEKAVCSTLISQPKTDVEETIS